MRDFDLTLYLVTDGSGLEDKSFLKAVEEALKNGVTFLQLREKSKSGLEFYNLAKAVKQIADKYNVPLIINDRIDIAMAIDADGVHLGQSDIPVSVARKMLGDDKIIGATTKTTLQAIKAEKDGANYLGVGAIYPTTTKVVTVITDVSTLDDICASVKIPVIAIGGLNKDNINVLENSPISGIAVVSAIMKSEDIAASTGELKKSIMNLIANRSKQ